MKKVIGIISEGPTDYLVLKAVIDKITGEENRYLSLQPEPDMLGRYGNGWKGVWRWCKETESIGMLMREIQPNIDAIVIQMDGDVVRKEKEVHCLCGTTSCDDKGRVFPLYCEKIAERKCPVELPCKVHKESVPAKMEHGKAILESELANEDMSHIAIVIPCDSTDTWVVAAYDEMDAVETFDDPWDKIIAKGKYYHGIRIRGNKKNTNTYRLFSGKVADCWEKVTDKCRSAVILEQEIRRILM